MIYSLKNKTTLYQLAAARVGVSTKVERLLTVDQNKNHKLDCIYNFLFLDNKWEQRGQKQAQTAYLTPNNEGLSDENIETSSSSA